MSLTLPDPVRRVETARFGPVTFEVGVDPARVETLLLRVSDAHERLHDSPLSQVADRLEREVVVSSVFGTNSIEGGTLTEEETRLALDLAPAEVADAEQRRALNIKAAYDLARAASVDPEWRLSIDFIRDLHGAITRDLPHEYSQPGLLRDNPKNVPTFVGDGPHGGRYRPPQFGRDVHRLLESLLDWHAELEAQGLPVLLRAPLVHYYYEIIHPFWDGNGRVGRVLEATLLLREGFQYAPFAQARFYLRHIDRYFTLFNTCRKAAAAGRPHPNTDFVAFFLEGMLESLNGLHGRVNRIVQMLLFETDVKRLHDAREINDRQYAIVSQVLDAGRPVPLSELRRAPWYLALYARLTDKTKQRDLRRLREQGLLHLDKDNRLWPGVLRPVPESK